MSNYESNNEQASDGVHLLLSMLIRYPEIGAASFDPEYNCLTLKFMLSVVPSKIEFSSMEQLVTNSITAYHRLEGLSSTMSKIQLQSCDNVAIVSIVRDVHTISNDEISLISTLLREEFKNYLIVDYNGSLLEEDLLLQEEVIEDMLVNMKKRHTPHRLIGIRENGRVVVFNK